MKHLLTFLLLIGVAGATIVSFAGHEAAIESTDDLIAYFHPFPPYTPKSREELIQQYRSEHIRKMQESFPGDSEFAFQQSVLYNPNERLISLQGSIDHARFKESHLEKYQDDFKSRIDMTFRGVKIVFSLLLSVVFLFWLRTNPFSRLSRLFGIDSLNKKTKLSILERELTSLRRMHSQGLVSDDAFGRKSLELQQKADKLLH